MKLFIDVESYCDQDLKAVGVYKYAETAKVILVAYSVDGGNVAVWDRAYAPTPPAALIEAMTACDTATSHNAQFERVVMSGPAQANLPQIPLTKWRCSMAQASSHALPAGLDELCEVLNLPSDQAKSKDGKKLIRLFCGPQPANRKIQHPTKQTHPDEWERFVEYCRQDVVALIAIDNLLPIWNWNASAIAEWHLNQVINDRGFKVDRELTKAAAAGAVVEKARIGERFRELTNGAVDRPSLRAQFLNYLNTTYALGIEDTTTATFQALLDKGVDNPVVAELLNLSMRGNKSSTAKYATLDEMTQNDGRFRGPLQFCGAGRTRRDAGRGFQGQNLPSRGLPKQEATDAFIEQIKAGTYDFSNPQTMRLASAALRGCIVPSAGNQLLIADLANIEGRLVAFLAGETWKIEAFKEYDKGTGPDLYNVTACSIVGGDPWNLPKSIRNSFGKVPELALGYQGGVAGIQQFAKGYGVKFADHWTTIQEKLAPQHIEWAQDSAKKAWAKRRMVEMGISEIEWTASEAVKLAWRHKHPKVKQIWQDLEGAFRVSWTKPNQKIPVGDWINIRSGKYNDLVWTQVLLPSGRGLMYLSPKEIDGTITYLGHTNEDGGTAKVWSRISTHGGKLLGNICQSIARDIFYLGLKKAEEQGYRPVLGVHDEAICDSPPDKSLEGLIALMAEVPEWLQGMPLAAAGFAADRYRKE